MGGREGGVALEGAGHVGRGVARGGCDRVNAGGVVEAVVWEVMLGEVYVGKGMNGTYRLMNPWRHSWWISHRAC